MRCDALLGGLLLAAIVAPAAHAAVVTVVDCTAPPVLAKGSSTSIDVHGDDLVIACPLVPLPGTGRIKLHARRITVAGPAGSVVTPAGKLAIKVRADADLTIENTSVETTGNGAIRLTARSGITINNSVVTTGGTDVFGRSILLQCNDAGCPLDVSRSSVVSNHIKVVIQGTITAVDSTVLSRGGRALVTVRSRAGDVKLCCDQVQSTNEGNVFIDAARDVDLSSTLIATGENIWVRAGLAGAGSAQLANSSLTNDFGKEGQIEVTAAGGAGQVDIGGASLVDDDYPRRSTDVSELNGREEVPHQGFNNTVGTPDTDT
ncbi:MAG TPA: hypothetical protein VKA21_03025 [Candidatus Binatia bacterium]|nr:hypothetical protein [Candidatus Binatia bacterium]